MIFLQLWISRIIKYKSKGCVGLAVNYPYKVTLSLQNVNFFRTKIDFILDIKRPKKVTDPLKIKNTHYNFSFKIYYFLHQVPYSIQSVGNLSHISVLRIKLSIFHTDMRDHRLNVPSEAQFERFY